MCQSVVLKEQICGRDAAVAARDETFALEYHRRQRQAVHHGLMLQLSAAHPSFRAAAQLASRSVTNKIDAADQCFAAANSHSLPQVLAV